ncbi:alpha/beta hydrolase [Pseudonocardia sp. NPDC049154]|uniref:alpha/beta hydrolase n=1 Tax=Pseudonocardia sp. NPDC049154 TaxID=3155501 RepID=UPI0033E57A99
MSTACSTGPGIGLRSPTGCGGVRHRSPELPFTSLLDDARVVRDVVASRKALGRRVVLVGHGYGGTVISEGGADADALVFLAATVPAHGETTTAAAEVSGSPLRDQPMIRVGESTIALAGPRAAVVGAFYNLAPPDGVDFFWAGLRAVPLSLFDEPTGASPAWQTVPSTYIVCEADNALPVDCQRRWVTRRTTA